MNKIAFLGSKPIGYKCLNFLLQNSNNLNCEVVAIFSNDNTRFGSEFSLEKLAKENGIKFGCSLDDILNCPEEFDFIISVQYHLILKKVHIEKARKLAVNLHMAPLPEYRGCNQFSFAIFNQSKIFGTTIHELECGIDSGKVIAERRFEVQENWLVKDLYDKTFDESILLFESEIGNILNDIYVAVTQENLISERGTNLYYRKDIDKLREIDLGVISNEVARKVRATSMPGFEPAFTVIDGMKFYIIPEGQYNQ
jgi:methionyl-tRNA formyltransferase